MASGAYDAPAYTIAEFFNLTTTAGVISVSVEYRTVPGATYTS